MSDFIIGTAGHIDHGKTQLILALTGIDTDRLKEEKERGISIDLGFAEITLPSGRVAGIVDVPGHEHFIKNMLAGATGFDLVLLVVAADDGVMPQTREHLAIIDLLGVSEGVVVITKADLVDEEMLELVAEEVRELIADTSLSGAEVMTASAVTGAGVEDVAAAIEKIAGAIKPRAAAGPFRLPIDRVFTLRGIGTVVTGTLWEGTLRVGDEARILPDGREVRIRNLQVHGKDVTKAHAGQRVALNLPGMAVEEIRRGEVIVTKGYLSETRLVHARLFLLPQAPRGLKTRSRIRFHHGTAEVMARVTLLGNEEEVEPGGSGLVKMRLEHPAVTRYGDRFIVRSYSPMATIGGGTILDSHPPVRARRGADLQEQLRSREAGDPADVVGLVLKRRGSAMSEPDILGAAELTQEEATAGLRQLLDSARAQPIEVEGKKRFIDSEALSSWDEQILAMVEAFHKERPREAGIEKETLRSRLGGGLEPGTFEAILARAQREGAINVQAGRVSSGGGRRLSEAEQAEKAKMLDLIKEGGFSPPFLRELQDRLGLDQKKARDLLSILLEEGAVEPVNQEFYLAAGKLSEAEQLIRSQVAIAGKLEVGDMKSLFDTSRKYSIPILEYFDRKRVTKREG
ncbi:MAG: selenocysteine-specific translation elongation factor, partial [Deltaproteobacteria bacterium HGW-Deltaproteobacteria-17]